MEPSKSGAWRKLHKQTIRAAAKTAAEKARTGEQEFVRTRLAAMKIPEFVQSEYADLRKHLSHGSATKMLGFTVIRHVIGFMDLPPAKKKAAEKIAIVQSNAVKALFEPITKKSALEALDIAIRSAKIAVTEGRPTDEQIKIAQDYVKILEERKKGVASSSVEGVSFDEGVAKIIIKDSSILLQRLIGDKNFTLMTAAAKQTMAALMKINAT